MTVVGILLVLALVAFVGRFLVRRLGCPTDATKAARWGTVLLACGLVLGNLRNCHSSVLPSGVGVPDAGDIVLLLLVLTLAVIGCSWLRGRVNGREGERRAMQVRRRALPPAPNPPQAPDGDPPAV
jgi:peptidoglycan/LPS O-acetylase OafA/YrhL